MHENSLSSSRRDFLTRAGATGVAFIGGVVSGILPADAFDPYGGAAGHQFISRTFGWAGPAAAYGPFLQDEIILPVYNSVRADLLRLGLRPRAVYGFFPMRMGVVAIDAGEGAGIATARGRHAPCYCVLPPEETGAVRSCMDQAIGLPAAWRNRGRTFTGSAALRYCGPVEAEHHREGCSRSSSLYRCFSEAADQACTLQIEPCGENRAHVTITSPTGGKAENGNVPIDPTIPTDGPQAKADDWIIG
jgi:hypothetical protein